MPVQDSKLFSWFCACRENRFLRHFFPEIVSRLKKCSSSILLIFGSANFFFFLSWKWFSKVRFRIWFFFFFFFFVKLFQLDVLDFCKFYQMGMQFFHAKEFYCGLHSMQHGQNRTCSEREMGRFFFLEKWTFWKISWGRL